MANKTRNANRKKQLKNKRKSRRQNQKKVKCVMCEKTTCKKSSLVPASCLAKNMDKSHRVCQKCWWDPKKGFALETSSHKCRERTLLSGQSNGPTQRIYTRLEIGLFGKWFVWK